MLISSARLIWLISWATRCETGACEVTHGHEAASAGAAAEAWLAAAVAGTASSTTAAQAASSRDFLDKTRQARVLSITLSSSSGLIPPYGPTQLNKI
jgi:ADP-ribosylglycohydrolase